MTTLSSSMTPTNPIALTPKDGGKGNGGGGAKGGGVTSLLEKYATLNNAITSTRSQISQTQTEISTIQNQITTIKSNTKKMLLETKKQINSIIPKVKNEHQTILNEYNTLLQTEIELKQSMMIEKRNLDQLKERREEMRVEFLNSCREFRINVRRNRVCLEGLLESSAGSNNSGNDRGRNRKDSLLEASDNDDFFLNIDNHSQERSLGTDGRLEDYEVRIEYKNNHHDNNENYINFETNHNEHYDGHTNRHNRDDEDGFTLSTTESTLSTSMNWDIHKNDFMTSIASPSSDLNTTTTDTPFKSSMKRKMEELSNDEEMNHAIRSKANSVKMLSQAKDNLDEIKLERKKIADRAKDRSKQLEQQRGQLERVRLDVQEMERKIALMEENTIECKQISEGYAKGKCVQFGVQF